MKPSEASELFLAFDENGDGGITEMLALVFPGFLFLRMTVLLYSYHQKCEGWSLLLGNRPRMEFMKALFPLDYRRIYRRASGVSWGA